MSRKSIAEYVAEKRRVYAKSGSAKRTRMIDEVCETLGYTRKYVIKLLTGNIRYRERKGRGKTYGDSVLANVRKLWEAVGCPCTTYFVAELPRIVREYEACIALIKPKVDKESIFAMSATTLDRDKGPEGTVRATERDSALPAGRPKTEAHTQAAGVLAGPAAADGVYLAMR